MPLLLGLGNVEVALVKAIESGNTDLVYTVLIHLHENMQLGDFEVSISVQFNISLMGAGCRSVCITQSLPDSIFKRNLKLYLTEKALYCFEDHYIEILKLTSVF